MLRVPRLLALVWLLALLSSGAVLAQNTQNELRLHGRVVGWTGGDPIPGTKLTLEIEGQEPRVLVTGEDGGFRFEGLPEGEYLLTVEVPGIASFQHLAVLDETTSGAILLIQCDPERGGNVRTLMPSAAPAPIPSADLSGDKGFAEVEVFYGTDRALKRNAPVAERFGPDRMRFTGLHMGVCKVSVPRDHRMGQIERPSIWKLEVTPDPRKHMVLLGMEALGPETFYRRLQGNLNRSEAKELMVFVHGYNVAFHDAALRTAQLAYDLGIDGAPVLYSWPSQASVSKYTVDEANVEWTVPHLERFLRDLSARSGARSVYLIAHSMGNRALTRALERIAGRMDQRAKPLFSEILLTAPDIDAEVFADLAQIFRRTGNRVTLYASSNDEALKLSKKVHGYPRAGDTGPNVVVLSGIDTIDVSEVDTSLLGHSYFGDNRTVISDIFNLLRHRKPPDQRSGLKKKEKAAGLVYWVFSP
ncbi:MAG TPA: alpha/beta hydrolase [Thermoanaerobaculia bacterium]|nr:alpha/beta hydrolase [Thermoanaerobaculia bacterium]